MLEFEFVINLQLFAEEKTEPATPKRRHESREKGQVAKSRELVTAVLLLITFWQLGVLQIVFLIILQSCLDSF